MLDKAITIGRCPDGKVKRNTLPAGGGSGKVKSCCDICSSPNGYSSTSTVTVSYTITTPPSGILYPKNSTNNNANDTWAWALSQVPTSATLIAAPQYNMWFGGYNFTGCGYTDNGYEGDLGPLSYFGGSPHWWFAWEIGLIITSTGCQVRLDIDEMLSNNFGGWGLKMHTYPVAYGVALDWGKWYTSHTNTIPFISPSLAQGNFYVTFTP